MTHGLAQFFWETRPKSASLEPLIDLLAYLEPKLGFKNPVFDKIQKVSKKYNLFSQGKLLPVIIGQQIKLESCSNPLKTHDVL